MSQTYNVRLSSDERMMLRSRSASDPSDEWELLLNTRIDAEQGNRNPFVKPCSPTWYIPLHQTGHERARCADGRQLFPVAVIKSLSS